MTTDNNNAAATLTEKKAEWIDGYGRRRRTIEIRVSSDFPSLAKVNTLFDRDGVQRWGDRACRVVGYQVFVLVPRGDREGFVCRGVEVFMVGGKVSHRKALADAMRSAYQAIEREAVQSTDKWQRMTHGWL